MKTTFFLGDRLTIADIKRANKATGHYFFSPDTMTFFNSHVELQVRPGKEGWYFITSEQLIPSSGEPFPRKWTVRMMDIQGRIQTVGAFQDYADLEKAGTALQALLAAEKNPGGGTP